MRHEPTRPARRSGFTMIELLVVMAIIAVLVALLMAAVQRVLYLGPRTQTLYEIGKLQESFQVAAKQYGNVKSLPGKLVLFNTVSLYKTPVAGASTTGVAYTAQDVIYSRDALRKMFGPRLLTNPTFVSWDGSNGANPANVAVLEGHQCLVFYLGGIALKDPATGLVRMAGFSVDPTNPSNFGTSEVMGPYYQFPPNRLVAGSAPGFYSYLDPYQTPYLYSGQPASGASNNYVSNYNVSLPVSKTAPLGTPVLPYVDPTGRFLNSETFQIVSAGRDKYFGPGGTWDPTAGSLELNTTDNLSNFSSTELGNPQ